MPQILDHNGQHALLPFSGKHHDGDSTLLRIMAKTTRLSTPVIDTANDISPLADENMRFLQGLNLGEKNIETLNKKGGTVQRLQSAFK